MGGSIQVQGLWKAIGGEHLQAYVQAAVEVLLVLEDFPERFPCGIVGVQDQYGGLGAEPLMGRAIEKKHPSGLS